MACTGVVHRDPGRRLQARPQHVTVLIEEPVLSSDQQAHHLSLRDGDADPPQLCHQPRHRDLALMVLRQHETTQLWPASRWRVIRTSNAYVFRDPQQRPVGVSSSKSENQIGTQN